MEATEWGETLKGMSGRKIKRVSWIEETLEWQWTTAKEGEELIFQHEYYGDHAENWVRVMKDGKEIRRENAKYIATIEWEEE